MIRLVLIDNYDSFTHNLAQLAFGLADEVHVVRNDKVSMEDVDAHKPTHLMLSPGPGRPERKRDFGVCTDLVVRARGGGSVPLLGVCLGHQGIAHGFGADIVRAPSVMHGKTSPVHHDGTGLFRGLPSPVEAMRYHSLVVDPSTLPGELLATAHSPDGVLQAFRHRSLAIHGLQFHPESIGTPNGRQMIANFLQEGAA